MTKDPDGKHWNRCNVCGRFIAMKDFEEGATVQMVTPDSEFTKETFETLCRAHAKEEEKENE